MPVGQTWSLTSHFSNNQLAFNVLPTTATREIRSGMSAGLGGTLIASGDTTATVTLLTPADANNHIDPEYRTAAAVTGVTLTAGTYWMAIAPDSLGYYSDQSYIETTSEAIAIGLPPGNDGRSFLNNNLIGSGKLTFAASSLDYSAGVVGTFTTVPEPTSGWMLVAALAGGFTWLRQDHQRRSSPAR